MFLAIHLRGFLILIGLLLVAFVAASGQDLSLDPARKLLPDKLGEFRAVGAAESLKREQVNENDRAGITSWASRQYVSNDGRRFSVILLTTPSDSVAYAQLMRARMTVEKAPEGKGTTTTSDIGTAAFSYWDGATYDLAFFKGKVFASVRGAGKFSDLAAVTNFSKTLAEPLEPGEGDIPVLIKHLPDWQNVRHRVQYVVTKDALKDAFSNQLILDAVNFDDGSEAVIADYGGPRLVIVEFNTPQVATENNSRIIARIQELRNQGQPGPSAYRRVGNYSVFVFDAPSELAANQLIDQVKYQQVVQWLGENPYSYREAVAEFTQTTLGVLVSVVKASGLVLLGSLVVGGFFGALLFNRRRARQQVQDAYSDAGGMLRLNLNEMNAETDPARLVGPRN
jgi:hypothetical protein